MSLLALAPVSLLRADISVQGTDVIAKPAKVRVTIGNSVSVPLIGLRPSSSAPVKFGITAQPEFGTLSEILPDAGDTSKAAVIYTPKPDAEEGTDTFRFNTKLEGKNASPSALVTVVLERAVARLSVEEVLPFGKIELGSTRTLPLRISNDGSKTFVKTLKLPKPWSIPAGQENLVVEPGATAKVDVVFTPETLKPSRHLLPLQFDNPNGAVTLSGAGAAPFARQYGTLDLIWDTTTGERRAEFRLANLTDRELVLKLSASPGLAVERLVTLEPREALNVPVSVAGIARYEGKILIESPFYTDGMPVKAEPTPAELVVLKPEERRLEFSLMDTDTPPVHEIVVTNMGGKKAFVYGETSRPFYISEGGDPTGLESGGKMTIRVSMDPREVGKFERKLTILGTANRIGFALSALVSRNVDRTQVGINLPDIAPLISASQRRLHSILPSYTERVRGINNRPRVTNSKIPRVEKIYLEEQKKRKLVFSWDHPGPSTLDYALEYEVYDKPEGAIPQPIWYRATEHVEVEKDEKGARMTLTKLQPGRQFRFRILTVDRAGHNSVPSRAELVYTLPRTGPPKWLVVPIALVLGGSGFFLWKRQRER